MSPGFPWLESQAPKRGKKMVAGSVLRRHLEDNPKQAFFVKAPGIFVKGLRLANKRGIAGIIAVEGMKSVVGVDIVYYDGPAGTQHPPRPIELETHVAFTVQTIVNEQVDLPKLCKEGWQPPPAGPFDVRPSLPMAFLDRHSHLRAKHRIQRRNIDARKMAVAVALQRFQNKPRSHPVAHAGLHHMAGPQMQYQAP